MHKLPFCNRNTKNIRKTLGILFCFCSQFAIVVCVKEQKLQMYNLKMKNTQKTSLINISLNFRTLIMNRVFKSRLFSFTHYNDGILNQYLGGGARIDANCYIYQYIYSQSGCTTLKVIYILYYSQSGATKVLGCNTRLAHPLPLPSIGIKIEYTFIPHTGEGCSGVEEV